MVVEFHTKNYCKDLVTIQGLHETSVKIELLLDDVAKYLLVLKEHM